MTETEPVMVLVVREQEFHSILAALRWYQHSKMGEPANRPDWLHEIATNDDAVISLDGEGVGDLCERINTRPMLIDVNSLDRRLENFLNHTASREFYESMHGFLAAIIRRARGALEVKDGT